MSRIGLVLGAGGAVGHAFHAGVLAALTDATGWDAGDAEVIVGTSAGSLVGAFVRAGLSGTDLAARSTDAAMSEAGRGWSTAPSPRPNTSIRSRRGRLGGAAFPRMSAPGAVVRAAFPPWSARPGAVAAAALPAGRISTEIIASGLRPLFDHWPDQPLWINAVDLETEPARHLRPRRRRRSPTSRARSRHRARSRRSSRRCRSTVCATSTAARTPRRTPTWSPGSASISW